MRFITKTSKQAKLTKDTIGNICPECNHPNLGLIIFKEGFFSTKLMNKYTCRKCRCEWNTGWRKV